MSTPKQVSKQDSTIDNANSRGESYAIANGFGLTAGHVLFDVEFHATKTTVNGTKVPQLEYSMTIAPGYRYQPYMANSYQSVIGEIAAEFVDYYNKWYVNYYTWLSAYKSWSSGAMKDPAPVLSSLGRPPYGPDNVAYGAITPQQAESLLLQPPIGGNVLNDPRAKAVDSVLAQKSIYKVTSDDPGLFLSYNGSDFTHLATTLMGSTQRFEIGDSATGQDDFQTKYPTQGSKKQLQGHVVSSEGTVLKWSQNAFPSNSGSGGLVSWNSGNYVFGNMVSTPAVFPLKQLPIDGTYAVLQGVGINAFGIKFTAGNFYNLNNIIEATSKDPGRDPTNLILGVNSSNPAWQVSGGGLTYSYSIGTDRRDLFVGTVGNEAFYASAGDEVDVGSGNNFVSFNPADDPRLLANGNMTVDFGKTASGAASGNTVVDVDTSADDKYDTILDLSSDSSITPDNIELIAGGQSLYWYPGVPAGQLAAPGGDNAFNSQWLSNADVEFLSVIDRSSTITFVDNKEKVGIANTSHQGIFSESGISPITTIRFAQKGSDGQNITWNATDIFNYIEQGEKGIKGNGGIDFLQGYGAKPGTNLDTNGDFDQYFTADPLKAGLSSISTTRPNPSLADASLPQLSDFAGNSPDVVVSSQSESNDPNTLYANGASQTLDPNGVYSVVSGEGGGDKFIFNQGYGAITVKEADTTTSPTNVLQLGNGLIAANTTVSATDTGDVILHFENGESVTLAAELLSANGVSYGVEQVQFADGTVWSYSDLLAQLSTPSVSNPVLYGDASSNILDGKGVSQTLEGFGGGDTFIFNQGYGALAIEEKAATGTAANILKLGAGLTAANTTVTADSSGTVTLDFGNGDQVWLEDQLNGGNGSTYGVQQIQFADGTTWTEADLVARLDAPSANATTLYGDNTGHTFDPAGVDNAIVSKGGGDTFLYEQGYGALTISESDESVNPANVLQLGTGITATGTIVTGDSSGDLILDFGNGDSITLTDALKGGDGTTYGVQTVKFADGTIWSYADLIAVADTPSATNTTLYASTGSYVLDGQGIATTVNAAGGGDTFIYKQGYGALTITEMDTSAIPDNVLRMGAGFSASTLVVTGDSNGDMILSFGSGDTITLTDGLMSGDGVAYGVQAVAFADGTTLSYANLLALARTPSATQTTLYGDASTNVLDGEGVAHTLVGQGSDTTFVFKQGYGQLLIDASDIADVSPGNTLQLGSGLNAANMAVTADGSGDLILAFGGGDAITINNALNSSNAVQFGIQQVNFADGSAMTYSQLLALADTPSTSNTTLYGDTGANTLDSAGIARTLVGNGGGDIFVFDQGYGALTIIENDPDVGDTNTLQLGAGISASGTSVSADASGDLGSGPIDVRGSI